MNLKGLIYLKRRYGKNMPGYIHKPSREEEAAQLNEALRWIGRYVMLNSPSIPFYPQANKQSYELRDTNNFGRMVTEPYRLYMGGMALTDRACRNRIMGIGEMDDYEDWRNRQPGIPTSAAHTGNGELLLDVPPTQYAVARGKNEIFAEYLPGVVTSTGIYLPHGFPTEFTSTDESSGSATGTPTIVEAYEIPYDGTLTAPGGALVVGGGAVEVIQSAFPGINGPVIPMFRDCNIAIPSGGTIQWVRVKSFRARSDNGVQVGLKLGVDVTVSLGAPVQYIDVPAGGAYIEYGPLPTVNTLGLFDPSAGNFGFQMIMGMIYDGSQIPLGEALQVEIDSVQIEVAYTVAGGSGGGTSWATAKETVPDLPVEFHESIAHIAVIMAANPMISDQEILANLQNVNRNTRENLKRLRSTNESMLGSLQKPQSTNYSDTYRVGR